MLAELQRLDLMLHRQVLRLRAARLLTEDDFRGLYIADDHVDALLRDAGVQDTENVHTLSTRIAQWESVHGAPLPALPFELTQFETDVLLIAAAPELDLRYETLYAYVQNDVTRKRPSVDLALKLLCPGLEERMARRAVFDPSSILLREHLVELTGDQQDADPPLPGKSMRAPRAVVDFLLGQANLDERLRPFTELVRRPVAGAHPAVPDGSGRAVWFLEGPAGSGKRAAAQAIAAARGASLMAVDLRRCDALPAILRRDATLQNALIYLDHWEAVLEGDPRLRAAIINGALELIVPSRPLLIASEETWRPGSMWPGVVFLGFEFAMPGLAERRQCWLRNLNGQAPEGAATALSAKFVFTPGQIEAAVREAQHRAGPRVVTAEELHQAARAQSGYALRRFAQKVKSVYQWDDIVLPPRAMQQLREVLLSIRRRETVFSQWGFERKLTLGRGVSVLFSGQSGTGKTMAASIVARELDLDMYKVDLAGVVSKYIGETEKNLSQIFQQAQAANAILFFDEADALFGKRSEVKDAHDRYANVEVAYLLQRMEEYEGIVVLATNLSKNIDEAFARRIQHTIEFPFPDAPHRERIWRGAFPEAAPVDAGVDFGFLARQFQLAGGSIRNIALGAAFLAAESESAIRMEHVILASEREWQKLGKLPSKSEFGPYYDLIRQRG